MCVARDEVRLRLTGRRRAIGGLGLAAASAKLRDHVDDGDIDGVLRVRATKRIARKWAEAGADTGSSIALDTRALLDVVADQRRLEIAPVSILDVTGPAETATALAFRHTAAISEHPENEEPLAEAGRLFGRLIHLLDAVEDLRADRVSGAWNPVLALDLRPDEVRRYCDDAALGVKLALREASFVDPRLVHVLLVHELESAVERIFTTAGHPGRGRQHTCRPTQSAQPPLTPPLPPDQQPPGAPPEWQNPSWAGSGVDASPVASSKSRNPFTASAGWLVVCGTCQICCAEEWTNPCTGEPQGEGCRKCDAGRCCDKADCCCDCGDCCDCCDCSC